MSDYGKKREYPNNLEQQEILPKVTRETIEELTNELNHKGYDLLALKEIAFAMKKENPRLFNLALLYCRKLPKQNKNQEI